MTSLLHRTGRSARTLLLLGVAACGGSAEPLPAVSEPVARLAGVTFGMAPAELLALRPEGRYDDEGVYREALDLSTVVSYGFLPWEEGRPPSGRASLSGVEIQEEVGDSLTLTMAWTSAIERASARTPAEPKCTSYQGFRLRRKTAEVTGTVHVTLLAAVVEAGDGQEYDASLTTRMETPEMAALSRSRRPFADEERAVACPGVQP
jgi:hypothetical protein